MQGCSNNKVSEVVRLSSKAHNLWPILERDQANRQEYQQLENSNRAKCVRETSVIREKYSAVPSVSDYLQ